MKYLSFISNDGRCWKISVTDNGDGFTEANVEGGGMLKIRASAVVWGAGPDGKVEYNSLGRNDDVYSWRPSQVKGNETVGKEAGNE